MPDLFNDTLLPLMAAWLLLATAAFWSHQQQLGLSRAMLFSSLRGLVQLLLLALVLDWIFAIDAVLLQILMIAGFCVLAGHNSAGHGGGSTRLWFACSCGLMAGCALTLPWLAWTGAIGTESRQLIPLGSMVAANGMNSISLLLARMKPEQGEKMLFGEGIRAAMIPSVDTLKVVGLVHMPGIFVGMVLAGSSAMAAATAQLVVLYMVITSGFTACCVTMLMWSYLRKSCA